jgi:VWFA-related protein
MPNSIRAIALSSACLALTAAGAMVAARNQSQGDHPAGTPAPTTPSLPAGAATGHRLWVFLFDLSNMQDADLARAKTLAARWLNMEMSDADLVSVETVRTTLALRQNFTDNLTQLLKAVDQIKPVSESDRVKPADADPLGEQDFFNNDLRYRGLRTLCTDLGVIEQKKAILLFTATRETPGADNQIEVRAAANACRQANASINPVEVGMPHIGGLQAMR